MNVSHGAQESVWDYPRPPRLEQSSRHLRVIFADVVIAETSEAYRVLETSHPPVYYFPPQNVDLSCCTACSKRTFCEWKGLASYYSIQVGDRIAQNAAWFYPDPTPAFGAIQNYLAFYPSLMDSCWIDDELVEAQPGDFYGGWITSEIVGPFKGSAGTWGW